jgi:hypothetical protein
MSNPPITPFWMRLREISLYPFQGAAFATLAVLTLARLVNYVPFGWLLNLLVWFALYKYAVAVLRATADGHMEAPEVSVDDESAGRLQIALQIVFVLMGAIGFAALGPVLGMVLAVVLGLAMPGATMSLAMEGDFWNALNPLTWVSIVSRIGWPYVAAALLCLVIIGSQMNAQALVDFLPPVVDVLVFYFIAQYAVLVAFHLMGYLIYQHHEELGHEVAAFVERRSANADPDQNLLDQAEHLVREGQPEEAEKLLGGQIRRLGGSAALHGQYRRLLKLRGDSEALTEHGRNYINVLMAQEQEKRALELARDCLADDPSFTLAMPAQVSLLAKRAADMGQAKLALDLLKGFHERHKRDPDVAANALMAARLMVDRFGQDKEARALLQETAAHFTDPALAAERDAYMRFLDGLAAPAARTS